MVSVIGDMKTKAFNLTPMIVLLAFVLVVSAYADEATEVKKRKEVIGLFQEAVSAFSGKKYSEAIEIAQKIQTYRLEGTTEYIKEAQSIIDRANKLRGSTLAPDFQRAKVKFVEGDYSAAREICEDILKRDPEFESARRLLRKLKKKEKESYSERGIIEANAVNSLMPSVSYYEKILEKLEDYK